MADAIENRDNSKYTTTYENIVAAKAAPTVAAPTNDVVSEAERLKSEEAARLEQQKNQQRTAISAAYDPIFNELDRQIGLVPTRQGESTQQLDTLIGQQKGDVEFGRTRSLGQLDQAAGETQTNANRSLRDLEGDIRNQIKARQFYFGALGAGDSSAPLQASEAISRGGQKARASIYEGRDTALSQINLKKADINSLASNQVQKIDEFKTNKLFELTQFFQDKIDSLNREKANADSTKQNAINNVIFGLEQDFTGRLRQLDDSIINYKSSVAQWAAQRSAALADYERQLADQKAESTGFDAQVTRFNNLVSSGVTPSSAATMIQKQYSNPSFLQGAEYNQNFNIFDKNASLNQ